MPNDFLLEARLKALDPELHQKYKNCVAVMSVALNRYEVNFPTYTNHSMRHSLDVIEFSNKLVGENNVELLNAKEIFCFLMAIYLHDFGMGISESDYLSLMPKVSGDTDPGDMNMEKVRAYHHELSGALIRKYAHLFEVDDEAYLYAIIQIARGHRVTDLLDESEFPTDYMIGTSPVCLPYLAALIRLADEIDIGRNRNPDFTYGFEYGKSKNFTDQDYDEFAKAFAVEKVDVEDDFFRITVDRADDRVYGLLMAERPKIERTLRDCIRAVNGRTRFKINQNRIEYERIQN